MSIVETIREFLSPSAPALKVVTVNSPVDYDEIPKGFFRVLTLSGAESRGWNGSFLCWRVGSIVVDGGQRHTCETPLSELPTVRLNFQKPTQNGSQHLGGCTVLDTDSLEEDTAVVWTGLKGRDGVAWV